MFEAHLQTDRRIESKEKSHMRVRSTSRITQEEDEMTNTFNIILSYKLSTREKNPYLKI